MQEDDLQFANCCVVLCSTVYMRAVMVYAEVVCKNRQAGEISYLVILGLC